VRQVASAAGQVEAHPSFQAAVTLGIVVAGVAIGVSTDGLGDSAALYALDLVCLLLFTVEAAVKVAALGTRPGRYFKDAWNRSAARDPFSALDPPFPIGFNNHPKPRLLPARPSLTLFFSLSARQV
jgi:hypothetical protein